MRFMEENTKRGEILCIYLFDFLLQICLKMLGSLESDSPVDCTHWSVDFCRRQHQCVGSSHKCCDFGQLSGWPLVWKTWKCQGIWQLSGKCQGFYWKSGNCQGKNLVSCLKLFIVNCIFVSIQVFSRSLLCLKCYVYGFGSCTVAFLLRHWQ